jgi:hypothetical protein
VELAMMGPDLSSEGNLQKFYLHPGGGVFLQMVTCLVFLIHVELRISTSRQGHFNKDSAKDQHAKAIERVNNNARKNGTRELKPFRPTF